MKVKLVGAIRRVNGAFHPFGAVVDVDKDQAERLMSLGVAVAPDTDVQEPSTEGDPAVADLSAMKVDALRELAVQRGVDVASDAKKADLIAALEG